MIPKCFDIEFQQPHTITLLIKDKGIDNFGGHLYDVMRLQRHAICIFASNNRKLIAGISPTNCDGAAIFQEALNLLAMDCRRDPAHKRNV